MNPPPSPTQQREARIDSAIAEYLIARQDGGRFNQSEWLAKHVDLATELGNFLKDEEQIGGILVPLKSASHDTVTQSPHRDRIESGPQISSPLSLPATIGDYELLEEIAHGGMGIVFKARQKRLNRIVAMKMVLGSRLASPKDIERFQREAEAAAGLDHPNIVPIYEVGIIDGLPFFSMKLIENGSLQQCKTRYLADPRSAAKLLAKAARGSPRAHQQGILHRDLKPSNILIDEKGDPHVVDFGLAKRIEDSADPRGDNTLSGAIIGSPSYMAPEQARGQSKQLTTAADVYGLGAILYDLLAGQPPFRAESATETLLLVIYEEPEAPSRLRPNVPRDLETICLKCLAKEPSKRYPSTHEFAQDLERWLNGEPVQARSVGRVERVTKWARRRPTAAALVIVSCLASGLVVGGLLVSNVLISSGSAGPNSSAQRL